jgi:hypothetical protein
MNRTLIIVFLTVALFIQSCHDRKVTDQSVPLLETNVDQKGTALEISFTKGRAHNYPTFAFWIEDLEGNYLETLYVTGYFGSGIFGHGSLGENKWDNKPGRAERPSALPYWLHQRAGSGGKVIVPSPEHPVPDAITSATPSGSFLLKTRALKQLPQRFRLVMEINQPWDWNEYWNNSRFPGEFNYSVSCQPALIYAVTVDRSKVGTEFFLNPIGHSHYSGLDGELYTDLTTITTAKDIVQKVSVKLSE